MTETKEVLSLTCYDPQAFIVLAAFLLKETGYTLDLTWPHHESIQLTHKWMCPFCVKWHKYKWISAEYLI